MNYYRVQSGELVSESDKRRVWSSGSDYGDRTLFGTFALPTLRCESGMLSKAGINRIVGYEMKSLLMSFLYVDTAQLICIDVYTMGNILDIDVYLAIRFLRYFAVKFTRQLIELIDDRVISTVNSRYVD